MKHTIITTYRAVRRRLSLKVIVGGSAGIFAWSLSGAGVIAVAIWGLKTIAIPLLMLKTASWGIWGAGVLRESHLRKQTLDAQDGAAERRRKKDFSRHQGRKRGEK